MMNKLARLSRRLAASLKVPAPELFGKFPVLRVLGSQASASREDSTLLRWAALVGLTGTHPEISEGFTRAHMWTWYLYSVCCNASLPCVFYMAHRCILHRTHSLCAGAFATGALTFTSQADALEQEQQKVKVVILGTGWGATSFLNALKPEKSERPFLPP